MAPGDPLRYNKNSWQGWTPERIVCGRWLMEAEDKATLTGDDAHIDLATHFSLVVYRMVEIESGGQVPIVSPEVAEPCVSRQKKESKYWQLG